MNFNLIKQLRKWKCCRKYSISDFVTIGTKNNSKSIDSFENVTILLINSPDQMDSFAFDAIFRIFFFSINRSIDKPFFNQTKKADFILIEFSWWDEGRLMQINWCNIRFKIVNQIFHKTQMATNKIWLRFMQTKENGKYKCQPNTMHDIV